MTESEFRNLGSQLAAAGPEAHCLFEQTCPEDTTAATKLVEVAGQVTLYSGGQDVLFPGGGGDGETL